MTERKYGGKRSFELPGISGYMELGMRFCMWAQSRNGKVTPKDVMKNYGVPYSTAWRWIRRWKDANGMYE